MECIPLALRRLTRLTVTAPAGHMKSALPCAAIFLWLTSSAVAAGQDAPGLVSMPQSIPSDPVGYLSKWDPYVLGPLVKTRETLSRNNGRQIARDSAGRFFVLAEKDLDAIYLGIGPKAPAVGNDFSFIELTGTSVAVFPAKGSLSGASMVIDSDDQLHVVWCQQGEILYAHRSVGNVPSSGLGQKAAWTAPERLAGAQSQVGDIMLDAAGRAAVCYTSSDTVYYLTLSGLKPENVGGAGAGMAPLIMPLLPNVQPLKKFDPAAPPAVVAKRPSYPPPMPIVKRQCNHAVMDLGPDGSIHLAFEREFDIWYARRTPQGRWLAPERAAWGLAFRPAIIVAGDRPLICFQYEGLRNVPLGGDEYLAKREGGGASIGYAVRTPEGWRTDYVAKAEEIIVNRQGTWEKRFEGRLLPMIEEMWQPVLLRDRHGVPWVLWQNTTRRWAYSARWLGDGFGEAHECRGPFCTPGQPLSAEKLAPPAANDMGLLLFAAGRLLFDRLKIPGLSLAENREVLFLDSLEVAQSRGLRFAVNPMEKHPANPLLSPSPVGSKDDRRIFNGRVVKRGSTYVMSYSYQSWAQSGYSSGALATSSDGIHWNKVERLPAGLPPVQGDGEPRTPVSRGYFDNPDSSDPAKRFMRVNTFGEVWYKGSKRVAYSPDGKHWSDGPEVSILNAIYEGGTPNLFDPLDVPQRRIKIYGRVFSPNARSCGMMWSSDLVHWHGAEHNLDPDDPYGKSPSNTRQGPLRGQIFLDACAGRGEDQLYSANVRIVDGLYFCIYWPCNAEHRYEGALAVSRDGVNFTRVKNGSRTLAVGPAGAWDSGIVKMDWPQRQGDRLMLYYGGSPWHHGTEPYTPPWHIGLATIRVHGWTCFMPAADEASGELVTIPIEAPPGVRRGLTLNVQQSASAAGVVVEVLNAATGRPIPGFAAAQWIPLPTDGIAMPARWKGGLALPTGAPIRLRFVLAGRQTRLYSFGFRTLVADM